MLMMFDCVTYRHNIDFFWIFFLSYKSCVENQLRDQNHHYINDHIYTIISFYYAFFVHY